MLKFVHLMQTAPAVLVWIAVMAGPAQGQSGDLRQPGTPAPATLSLAQKAARRWPQPVRVGDLQDRLVIEPSNRQTVLGRVDGVVRSSDGALSLVVRYGGVLGMGTRPIAVPVDAIALLGQFVEVVDLDRTQLAALPSFEKAGATALPPAEIIRIGVTRN